MTWLSKWWRMFSRQFLMEVLDFLRFLKTKAVQAQQEDAEDLAEVRLALEEVAVEGTVAWEDLKIEVGL